MTSATTMPPSGSSAAAPTSLGRSRPISFPCASIATTSELLYWNERDVPTKPASCSKSGPAPYPKRSRETPEPSNSRTFVMSLGGAAKMSVMVAATLPEPSLVAMSQELPKSVACSRTGSPGSPGARPAHSSCVVVGWNSAVTCASPVRWTVQVVVDPEQAAPFHALNMEPEAAVAVSTTSVPSAKLALHDGRQATPAGVDCTLPLAPPVPEISTLSMCVAGPPDPELASDPESLPPPSAPLPASGLPLRAPASSPTPPPSLAPPEPAPAPVGAPPQPATINAAAASDGIEMRMAPVPRE